MLTRRALIPSSLALLAFAAGASPVPQARAQTPEEAVALIKQTADKLIAVINSNAPAAQKQEQLREIIDSAVDVNEVARFCLGRYWRVATPAQRQEYLDLFHRVLVHSITGRIGQYQGVTYSIGRPVPQEGGIVVPTVINRPGQPPANVSWVVSSASGSPKIIDMIAEGTSLRITQRSDYASYIAHNGDSVQALLDAMRRQASQGSQAG
jgi:phospholipid transport system substrate-binding protein